MISRSHQFLYIHIPKTAGTALAAELARYCSPRTWLARRGTQIRGIRSLIVGAVGHDPVKQLTGLDAHASYSETVEKYGARDIEALYSFGVIRNPFVRAVSVFEHMQKAKGHPKHEDMRPKTFNQVLPSLLEDGWFQQAFMVADLDSESVLVGELVAYETLKDGLAALSQKLKLPRPLEMKPRNVSAAKRRNIEAAFAGYVDQFVEALAADFRILGYSTDPSRAYEPPQRR